MRSTDFPSGDLRAEIGACRLCAARFAATATGHRPRPVPWFQPGARLLIAGQAPGARVHASGIPFDDRSGDRLRDWLGLDREAFYDQARVAIVPMAFCFPGYSAKGSDLPPPPICAKTWRSRVMEALGPMPLTVVIGQYAMRWHMGGTGSVTDRVAQWQDHWPAAIPLPHPSWRNTGWIKRNPWFEADVLPALKHRVAEVMSG